MNSVLKTCTPTLKHKMKLITLSHDVPNYFWRSDIIDPYLSKIGIEIVTVLVYLAFHARTVAYHCFKEC